MWTEKSGKKTRLCTTYIDPLTGERHKIGVTFQKDTPQQRNKAERKLDALVMQKLSCTPAHITLKELTDLYLADQRLTLKQSTCRRNQFACNTFIKIFGADCDVTRLTAGVVKQKLIAHKDNPTTVNEFITRYKALMRWAYRNDYIANISYLDKLVKLKDRTKKEKVVDKFLESSECEILIDALPEQWQNMTRFLILSGLRIGECLALDESDLIFDTREITVNKTLDVVNDIVTSAKTLASNRMVFMQDELYALSRSIIAQNRKKRKILYIRHAPLFFDETGAHASYGAYNKCLREVSARVLGRPISPHTLRHTHASLLAEQGLPYDTIARRLGHEDSRITKEIYIHVTEKRKEKENDMLREVKIFNFA